MSELAQYLGTGEAQDVGRARHPPAGRRQDVDQRPLARGVLPAPRRIGRWYLAPLEVAEAATTYDLRVRVHGGGVVRAGRGGAARHARALVEADPEIRIPLKRQGFLTRDARIVERKKAGLHKARKAPQFSKR